MEEMSELGECEQERGGEIEYVENFKFLDGE